MAEILVAIAINGPPSKKEDISFMAANMTLELQVNSDEKEIGPDDSSLGGRYLWVRLLVGMAVLIAGAIEGRYGKSELFGDDISYLDVANMIRAGDWRAALNPLWSIGYPLLLSVVRRLFPSIPHGEMAAVFWLNLAIYFVAWIGFLWLLRLMSQALRGDLSEDRDAPLSPFLLICAACVFVAVQTGVGRVSTVGPDLLVTCLFFRFRTCSEGRVTANRGQRCVVGSCAWFGIPE
ncbi:hypothetical protein [Tunturiibacter gelidiferens]|uniref:hypothetical protein n=1 Tax=Tunturiibacter gelidiferens TaxID=3069689 RepID=UPI003D9B0374